MSKTGVTWLGKPCPRPHEEMMHDMQREAGIYAKRSNSFARWSTPRVVRSLGEYTSDAIGANMANWDVLQGAAADGTPDDVKRAIEGLEIIFKAKGEGPRAWIDTRDDNDRTALMLAVIREVACYKVALSAGPSGVANGPGYPRTSGCTLGPHGLSCASVTCIDMQ